MKIDIAVNIHSFPECNINDIEWWIKLINSNKIKLLGPGKNRQYRTYIFAGCEHKQEIQTGHVRAGNFKCKQYTPPSVII